MKTCCIMFPLNSKRIPLGLAFNTIPAHSQEMLVFRLAYSYRHLFDYLAESGSEQDPTGLQAAVARALSYSVGFGSGGSTIYLQSGRGIDTIDNIEDYLEKGVDNRQFKGDLYGAAIRLPELAIERFFSSLGNAVIERTEPIKPTFINKKSIIQKIIYRQDKI